MARRSGGTLLLPMYNWRAFPIGRGETRRAASRPSNVNSDRRMCIPGPFFHSLSSSFYDTSAERVNADTSVRFPFRFN